MNKVVLHDLRVLTRGNFLCPIMTTRAGCVKPMSSIMLAMKMNKGKEGRETSWSHIHRVFIKAWNDRMQHLYTNMNDKSNTGMMQQLLYVIEMHSNIYLFFIEISQAKKRLMKLVILQLSHLIS